MSLCRFESNRVECMMSPERDGYCVSHWRLQYGHAISTEGLAEDDGKAVPPYCRICGMLMANGSKDDPCGAKMLKALIEGNSPPGQVVGVAMAGMRPDVPKHTELDKENAFQVLMGLLDMIPPCPDCEQRRCVEWLQRYFAWIMNAMLGPSGFMAMFISILERNGGQMEFTKQEVMDAGRVLRVESEVDEGRELLRAVVMERAEEGEEVDEGWPDLIG